MKRSTERILTTHVGSLPRPRDLDVNGPAAWARVNARERAVDFGVHPDVRLKRAGENGTMRASRCWPAGAN